MYTRDLRHLANLGRCARALMSLVREGCEAQAAVEMEGLVHHSSALGYHDEWPEYELGRLLKRNQNVGG